MNERPDNPISAGAQPDPTERGYVLLVFVMFAAVLLIGASRVLPKALFEGQREREEELIFRGQQYQRAIQLFVRKVGRYPNTIEELEKTNEIRFLRKRYKDPMTQEGEWRLIHIGPGGIFTDSKTSLTGPKPPESASEAEKEKEAARTASDPAASGTAVGRAPGDPALNPSATAGANPGLQPRAAAQSQPFPFPTPPGAVPQPSAAQPAQQVFGGGGIAGVASQSTDESIRILSGYSTYEEWEFLFDYRKDPVAMQRLAPTAPVPIPGLVPGQQPPGAPGAPAPTSPQQPPFFGVPPGIRTTPPQYPPSPILPTPRPGQR